MLRPTAERVPVEPLHANNEWATRSITLLDDTAALFEPIMRHAGAADLVFVRCGHADDCVVMMSSAFWYRVLATVAVASGRPAPTTAPVRLELPA